MLQIRKQLPRLGTRKLHYTLHPLLEENGITIGMDKLFELLQAHKPLIRRRKRKVITTTILLKCNRLLRPHVAIV